MQRPIDADRMLSELKPITFDTMQSAVTIADTQEEMKSRFTKSSKKPT